ncbi:hypothetical protein FRB90_003420, partial [Tulasnella sp. 427]
YRELFPFHESGVHPASKGNPKSTQLGEVHIALARNADFIYKKLKVARASTMSLSEWEKHKELYDRSSVSREPFYEAASESESEEEIFSDEEDKDDNYGMDFEPMPPVLANRGAESLRREPSRELTRDASVAGGLYEEASEVLNFPSVDAELSLGTEKKSTIKYRPILRPNFQWNCPFNSLVAAPDEAHKYQCVWKINLLKLTREQVTSISRELRELVDTPMKNLNNPSLSVLLAALLDPHLVKHSKRRSGMKSIAGVYQVEVPIDPSAADWVARASNINMLPQIPQKRARMMSTTGGRPPVGLHLDLPPPDLSQFKAPGDAQPQPPAQAGPSAAASVSQQQPAPLFVSEVKEMFYCIRGAALKGAEIVRYQTDMKQIQGDNDQPAPVPKHLLGAFRRDTERLDQVCDVIEAKILRLMSVLVREINREKAKAAEDAAAKAALEQEQAAAAAAAALAATDNEASMTETVKSESMEVDTQPAEQPSDADKMPPPPEPNSKLAPPRVSSTAPSVVSLSTLPSSSLDLSEAAAAAAQTTKVRLARNFSLKIDLPAPSLGGSFPGAAPTAAASRPASPVTLAPKSARPRNDDPASAFGLMTAASFNPALLQQLSAQAPPSAFVPNGPLPFSGVGNPTDTNALIPDILSSVNAAQQVVATAAQASGSLPNFSTDVQDVIDLTGNSPLRGQMTMPINVDVDPSETIDLTMDSPTIPLSQVIASNRAPVAEGEAVDGLDMTGIEGPSVGAKGEEGKVEEQPAATSLEGLLASAQNDAQPITGDAAGSTLPTDATSLLATLTGAGASNDTNGVGSSSDTNPASVFQNLIPSAGDFGDLGMDLSAFLPSGDGTSGAGVGLGGGSADGIFEFGGLMGDAGAGATGVSSGMDFDVLGNMGIFGGMDEGSGAQNS